MGRATENVVIRDCLTKRGHGGCLVIGSDMSGDVRNVYAYHCRSRGTNRGVRLKSARGRGGVVENVWVEDMTWEDLQSAAISLNTFYTAWAVLMRPNAAGAARVAFGAGVDKRQLIERPTP